MMKSNHTRELRKWWSRRRSAGL